MQEEKKPYPENNDVFQEAMALSMNKVKRTITLSEERSSEVEVVRENKVKNWKDLKKAMDNEHAAKFNRILSELPDREFVRVYLKAQEFFKPKVVREKNQKDTKTDNTINVQINLGK